MFPYVFTAAGRGYINITKTDGQEETRFILYTQRSNGYGGYTSDYGCHDDEYQLHRLSRPGTFEYFSATDNRYYRIPMSEIREAIANHAPIQEPEPLPVRHEYWFGESPNEIRRRIAETRKRRLEEAIAQAKQRKADAEERERREAEEAAKRERIEAEVAAAQTESFEDELARLLAEAGLSEYAE